MSPTNLTKRERQVLELIANGLSNKEIANNLTIKVATVENHIHNLYGKLNISKRSQAITYAFREGIFNRNNISDKLE